MYCSEKTVKVNNRSVNLHKQKLGQTNEITNNPSVRIILKIVTIVAISLAIASIWYYVGRELNSHRWIGTHLLGLRVFGMWNVNVNVRVHSSTLSIISSDSKNRQQPQDIGTICVEENTQGNWIHLKLLRKRGKVYRSVSLKFKQQPKETNVKEWCRISSEYWSHPLLITRCHCADWIQYDEILFEHFLPLFIQFVYCLKLSYHSSYLSYSHRKFIVIIVLY